MSRGQLGLVYLSGSFGFGFQQMAAFLVPLRAHELNAPLDQIGLIVGAGAVVPALLSVWSGQLADRFGARRTYIGGTLLVGADGPVAVPGHELLVVVTHPAGNGLRAQHRLDRVADLRRQYRRPRRASHPHGSPELHDQRRCGRRAAGHRPGGQHGRLPVELRVHERRDAAVHAASVCSYRTYACGVRRRHAAERAVSRRPSS